MAEIKIEDITKIEYIERSFWAENNEIKENVLRITIDTVHEKIFGISKRFSERQAITLAKDILNIINNINVKYRVIDGPIGKVNIYFKDNHKETYNIHNGSNGTSVYEIISHFMEDNDVYY